MTSTGALVISGYPKYLPCIRLDLDDEGLETPRRSHEWISLAPVEPRQAQTAQIGLVNTLTAIFFS